MQEDPSKIIFHSVLSANFKLLQETLSNLQSDTEISSILNKLDNEGNSALHYASQYNEPTFILELLNHGADGLILNKRKNSILHSAAQACAVQATTFLLSHENSKFFGKGDDLLFIPNEWQETFLHLIFQTGDMNFLAKVVQCLPKEKMETLLKMKDQWGRTPKEVFFF